MGFGALPNIRRRASLNQNKPIILSISPPHPVNPVNSDTFSLRHRRLLQPAFRPRRHARSRPPEPEADRNVRSSGCTRARRLLATALEIDLPCPDEMIGSLAALPLPDGSSAAPKSPLYADPLQEELLAAHGIEVPIVPWPAPPKRLIRVSAQLYNDIEQYERLASALRPLVAR